MGFPGRKPGKSRGFSARLSRWLLEVLSFSQWLPKVKIISFLSFPSWQRRQKVFLERLLNLRRERPLLFTSLLSLSFLLIFLLFLPLFSSPTWGVFVDGKRVATVRKKEAVAREVSLLVQKLASEGFQGVSYVGKLTVEKVGKKEAPSSSEELREVLKESLGFTAEGRAIVVDGKPRVVLKDEASAKQTLALLKAAFLPPEGTNVLEVKFAEEVSIVPLRVKVTEIVSPEKAAAILRGEEGKKYIVKEGDTLWGLAQAIGTTVEELMAANPQLDADFLALGEEIYLTRQDPPLHVVVTYEEKIREAIPYRVEARSDRSLSWGVEKVLQEGEEGEKETCYRVTTFNGKEVAKEVVATTVLKEPVTKVVARGTNLALAARGGGILAWPCAGGISSGFGYRGGEFHAGIDLAGSWGDPVWAAAPGVVVAAGWEGGYGYCVTIDHGGGLETKYAHLSAIYCRVGEELRTGDVLGAIGATGWATGPHLHFEVIINGIRRNPLDYLR